MFYAQSAGMVISGQALVENGQIDSISQDCAVLAQVCHGSDEIMMEENPDKTNSSTAFSGGLYITYKASY